ncbi:MAG: hypothetical protein AABW47_04050 [Nanoarchaeota archaeon]
MDSFLDITVIINSFEYNYVKDSLKKKCFEYVKENEEKILISFFVQEGLKRAILKRKEIYNLVLKKIKDTSYEIVFEKAVLLNKKDILFANNLYSNIKKEEFSSLKNKFDNEINFLNFSTSYFLEKLNSKFFIKEENLDSSLISLIHSFIADHEDCKVLASAIQIQKDKKMFFFVTADQHFIPGSYDALKEDSRLEGYKIPELINLLYN